jgi:hypothetical protein
MLFDATRRNPTVLYVTQRQNGLMVEGHREIMGSAQSQGDKRGSGPKAGGVIGTRASRGRSPEEEEGEGQEGEGYQRIMDHAADQETALLRKHPLRIDIRDNNPEQMVAERLLEATEYSLPAQGSKQTKTLASGGHEDDGSTLSGRGSGAQDLSSHRAAASASVSSSRVTRPHSASQSRPPRSNQHFSTTTATTRPASSGAGAGAGRSSGGISGEGIRSFQSRRTEGGTRYGRGPGAEDDDDDEYVAEDEDDALLLGGDEDQNSYLRAKLIEKRNERLEGARGAGVGSLLDTEIRKMQIQSAETLGATAASASASSGPHKASGKKLKRRVIVSHGNGLVKRSQAAPSGGVGGTIPGAGPSQQRHLGAPIVGSRRAQPLPLAGNERKKKEMRGVYATPVIRPIAAIANPKGTQAPAAAVSQGGGGGGGFVERKRVGLSLSKSAPQISRPRPHSANGTLRGAAAVTLGAGGGLGGGSGGNPYTQRSLNPGILF